ncbi:hypothetical protein JOB18_019205 [Solea senegalensis]|uniref:Uncharacterized protein n=1 Tax=Solea senegalensis TaxID=28829 RepID=A0AAV6QLH7_SOLSE|nr:hypothetical protein JOB18_019205 [Solea senegalensis]
MAITTGTVWVSRLRLKSDSHSVFAVSCHSKSERVTGSQTGKTSFCLANNAPLQRVCRKFTCQISDPHFFLHTGSVGEHYSKAAEKMFIHFLVFSVLVNTDSAANAAEAEA